MVVNNALEVASMFALHHGKVSERNNDLEFEQGLLDWLLENEDEKNYINDMSDQGYRHLVFQCLMAVLHVFLAIPTNVFTLVVIGKTKSLWTLSNTIFVINALFMALASASACSFRLSHFPLLFFSEKNRVIAYRVGWLLNFVFFRVGNFR